VLLFCNILCVCPELFLVLINSYDHVTSRILFCVGQGSMHARESTEGILMCRQFIINIIFIIILYITPL